MIRYAMIAVIWASALVACAAPGTTTSSLYDRFGGEALVKVVADDAIDAIAAAPDGQRAFDRVKLPRVKQHLAEFLCVLMNGPCTYRGDDMTVVHRGLAITEREFNALVEILRDVLARHGVAEREKNELLRLLAPMKRVVVTASLIAVEAAALT
jgi:hemoglobin